MKILQFQVMGTVYECSLEPGTLGHVTRYDEHRFNLPHESWVVTGFANHHWCRSANVRMSPDVDPKALAKCFVFDRDHGTNRLWAGRRIQWARVVEVRGSGASAA